MVVSKKDVNRGKTIDNRNEPNIKHEQVDGTSGAMTAKDADEAKNTMYAARLSSAFMSDVFVDKMAGLIDEEKETTHSALASALEKMLSEEKLRKRLKIMPDMNMDNVTWAYSPIVQSGGSYDLKPKASSNSDKLHAGVIIASIGLGYKGSHADVARTFLIDPTREQEAAYEFLLSLRAHLLRIVKDNAVFADVYISAVNFTKANRPEFVDHLLKNFGFALGAESRNSNVIGPACQQIMRADQMLNLTVGLSNLINEKATDEKAKKYSLLLIDTVKVTPQGGSLLTDDKVKLDDAAFYFKDENDPEVKPEAATKSEKSSAAANKKANEKKSVILKSKTRYEEHEDRSNNAKRKAHQRELAAQKQREGLSRFTNTEGTTEGTPKPVFKKFESYKKESQLPKEAFDNKVVVDHRNDTIIVPINGQPVPFHISTLKNASKSEESGFVYLRLNFQTPGQISGKKEDVPFDDPSATFVRALTYKSADSYRLTEIYKSILELKKNVAKRELEKKERADIVEQASLIEVKGKRPIRLADVLARPNIDTKRAPGELEIHVNGLRFQSPLRTDVKIDVLFSNIKHLFFQPCEGEVLVLLHVHLKNPILIGKKK